MRVLLAIDGSESAARATDLVRNVAWPPGSTIRLVSVVRPVLDPSLGMPGLVTGPEVVERMFEAALAAAQGVVTEAAITLRADDRTVEQSVLQGRPASVIADLGRTMRPDLIILGSHGRGPVASTVLGSVSIEVVETAGCPVLVARGPSIGRLVLADDGSPDAGVARNLVATMPGFRGMAVRVVSVAELSPSWYGWLEPAAAGDTQAFEEAIVRDRERYSGVAADAAELLSASGLMAEVDVRSGDAGHEIVAAAAEFPADLIVMGTRGQTGLARILLGSVARRVLQHAHCSVLVVPRPRPTGHDGHGR